MNFENAIINLIISLFAIAPIVYVIAGIKSWSLKHAKGLNYFSMFMFSVALYSLGYFLEINSTNPDTAFFLRNFEYLGTSFVPTFCILFIIQHTNLFKIKPGLVALFCSISFGIWLLYLTNPQLGFFYKSILFSVGKYGGEMLTEKNFGYYLLLLYYSIQIVIAGILLFRAVKTAKTKTARRSYMFLFFTFQSSWISVIFILAGFDKFVDPTPLTLMVIGGLFAVNEIYNDMFERNIFRWKKNYSTIKYPAFLVDQEGIIVCSNDAADIYFTGLNKKIEDCIPALDDGEKNRKPVMFSTGRNTKWVDVKKNTLDKKGTLTNYLLLDVSDDKHASLMAELFFDAVGDFVIIVNKAGEILFVNSEVKGRLGFVTEEIKQMHILDFHPATLRSEIQNVFEKALDNKVTSCRFPLQAKNGKTIPVETRVWLDNWNGEPVLFFMSKDISLFEEAEEKFVKSFYKNPAIMAITDADTGEYIDVNDAFIRKLGYSKQEVIGNTAAKLNIILDNNQRIKAKQQLLLNGEFTDMEVDIRAKDGSVFNGLFYGSYITLDNSINLLTVMIDVTESSKRDNLLRIITSITQDFLKSLNFMEPITKAFTLLGEAFDVSRVFLMKADLDEAGAVRTISPIAEWCSPDADPQINNPDLQKIPAESVMAYLTPLLQMKTMKTDVKALDECFLKSMYTGLNIKSVLTLPVFEEEAFWGFVCLHECRHERQWTPLEENILKVFVDSLTMALQRYQSVEKIEYLSFHDQLTGIYNRRFYEQTVLRMDNERFYPLTLVMADVNGLKLTNDAFGHGAGDLLLQRIAAILNRECRAQDIVARIGGDEFVILLPETDAKNAKVIINRINKVISKERIDNLFLSVSIGFASKKQSSEDMTDVFKQAEDMMYRNKLSESSSVRSKTIDLILHSLFEKNGREMQHSHRVGNLCESIAREMDFSKDDISQMSIAGLMHDIGKIGISEESLNSPDKLHSNEWTEIKRHSEIGYRILSSVSEFSKIAEYVLEHHEKPDGSGYPKGLKGDEISLQAKIISLADSYDAMTSERTYKNALSDEEAVEEIKRCCGTQFDPEVAKVFVEKVLKLKW